MPDEVAPGLWLGDRADAKDRVALRRLKISSVVNCTPSRDLDPSHGCPSFFEKDGSVRYLRVPIFDTVVEDAGAHVPKVVDFVSSRLHHGGVLVHCNRGVSRSATFVVAFCGLGGTLPVEPVFARPSSPRVLSPPATPARSEPWPASFIHVFTPAGT